MDRKKRVNAGKFLPKLLNVDEKDQKDLFVDFYGRHLEEDSDVDYKTEEEEEDIIDSDFSIDEDDQVVSDNDEAVALKPEKKTVKTIAYKEPVKTESKTKRKPKVEAESSHLYDYRRRSGRGATIAKSVVADEKAIEKLEEKKEIRKKPKTRTFQQCELLAEAELTAIQNTKSFQKFHSNEQKKKTVKSKKAERNFSGPTILYHSLKMPDGEGDFEGRSFITVKNDPNDVTFNRLFAHETPKRRQRKCVITGMDAKYVDPVTQLPYYNSTCFKIIRAAYTEFLVQHGNRENPDVSKWLDYYMKNNKDINNATEEVNDVTNIAIEDVVDINDVEAKDVVNVTTEEIIDDAVHISTESVVNVTDIATLDLANSVTEDFVDMDDIAP